MQVKLSNATPVPQGGISEVGTSKDLPKLDPKLVQLALDPGLVQMTLQLC